MKPEDRLDEALQQTHLARKELDDSFLSPFRSLMLKMAETRLSSVYKSMTGEQWVPRDTTNRRLRMSSMSRTGHPNDTQEDDDEQ